MTIDEVTGGKIRIGSTTYNMVEAKYNGVVVWPASQPVVTTYTVVAASVYYTYSDGGNILLANGNNLASAWGDVLVQEDGVTVDTLYGQRLDVFLPEGSYFHINNNRIQGDNLGTNEVGPYDSDVLVSYLTSARVTATTKIYQERNTDTITRVVGPVVYDHTGDVVTARDYGVSIALDQYDSSSDLCPASGGVATITSLSAWHFEDTVTPWSQTTTTTHSYASGAEQVIEDVERGTELTDTSRITDTPTISIPSSAQSWLSYDASTRKITIASEGTTIYSNGRNATVTATNNNASDSVTIYQQYNKRSTNFSYNIVLEIQHTGNLPGTAGQYGVEYTSERTMTETYTSGASNSDTSAYNATVTPVENCSTDAGTVSGHGVFNISVDRNPSTSQTRTVSVRLVGASASSAIASKTQDAYVPNEATFTAVVWAGPTQYQKGHVYYNFNVTSGSLTSATLPEVILHYELNGGSETTVRIGSMSVQDMGGTALAELTSSGDPVPVFASGSSVTVWFSASGSGGFDSISYPHTNFDVQ